jgi:hypothetical protein
MKMKAQQKLFVTDMGMIGIVPEHLVIHDFVVVFKNSNCLSTIRGADNNDPVAEWLHARFCYIPELDDNDLQLKLGNSRFVLK